METPDVNNQNDVINNKSLFSEIQLMLNYAYNKGIKLPDSISQESLKNDEANIAPQSLVADYNSLISAILPATPESIKYISNEFEGSISKLRSWKLPVVKRYIAISILALVGLVAFSMMPGVTAENQEKGILSLSGIPLLENLFVIFFASLLGVMFYILKTVKDKVDDFTLVSVDIFEYNISIIIGIVSGFIISELFTFTSTIMGSSIEAHKMTLALLGGFASDAIFSILQNMVIKVKGLFAG